MTTRLTTVEFIRDLTDADEAAETSPNPTLPVIGTWAAADNAAVPAAVDLGLGAIRDDSALDDHDVAVPDVAPAVILDSIRAAARDGGCHQQAHARRGPYLETSATVYGDGGVKGRVAQSTSSARATSTGAVHTSGYERPDGFYRADSYYKYAGDTNYTTCGTGDAGHSYWRSSSNNGQFSAGVELPGPNLSAQSGFSSSQEVACQFTNQGKLCGSGGKPWGSAPRLSARTS